MYGLNSGPSASPHYALRTARGNMEVLAPAVRRIVGRHPPPSFRQHASAQ
jgi:hypothetical protein